MEGTGKINIDVDQLVAEIVSEAQKQYEEIEVTYDAAIEASQSHLDSRSYTMTEQMFIIETLLATRGLDKGIYLHHTVEDADDLSSTEIIKQLCENALTAIALQDGFDRSVSDVDTAEKKPPQELGISPESVVNKLETELDSQYNDSSDVFDAVYDTLEDHWSDIKSRSLTEQAAVLQYLAEVYGIEDATPSQQLEDSVNDNTELVIGSLLWHNLQQHLESQLTTDSTGN